MSGVTRENRIRNEYIRGIERIERERKKRKRKTKGEVVELHNTK